MLNFQFPESSTCLFNSNFILLNCSKFGVGGVDFSIWLGQIWKLWCSWKSSQTNTYDITKAIQKMKKHLDLLCYKQCQLWQQQNEPGFCVRSDTMQIINNVCVCVYLFCDVYLFICCYQGNEKIFAWKRNLSRQHMKWKKKTRNRHIEKN